MDPSKPIRKRRSTFLPHWEQDGATYSVTFRLADSLPTEAVEKLLTRRRSLSREFGARGIFDRRRDLEQLRHLWSEEFERLLDAGTGECLLRDDRVAAIVVECLKHFDEQRYKLIAWCIMPNHVHVVVRPVAEWGLEKLLHTWKSFTAHQVNKLLNREGTFWQDEYFDRLVRDDAELASSVQYVLENPWRSGLKRWTWVDVAPGYFGLEKSTD
ncbi:MAG: transposase [Planctomycetes bacterium]|nr:transposase [Planctomycetota bacterium]